MSTVNQSIKVWDPIVRIGHWTLVIAFFTAYFTEDDFLTQHVWAGYVVAGVVMFRILWGIIGSKHARFEDFIYKPSEVIAFLKNLAQRKPQHYLGHNPAGGVMVIALMLSLSALTYSGFALYAVEKNAGPFASVYGQTTHNQLNSNHLTPEIISSALAKDESYEHKEEFANKSSTISLTMVDKNAEAFWEGLHEFFANFTLLLVALHVCGVILSSYIDKENLIKAMLTGRKEIH